MSEGDSNIQMPLAITGMACRLPGASDLDSLWDLIIGGKNAIGQYPSDRVDPDVYYSAEPGATGRTHTRLAGVVSPQRANSPVSIANQLDSSVDDAHRSMCEVAELACRHAGLDPWDLTPRNTGVYVGHDWGSQRFGDQLCAGKLDEAAEILKELPELQHFPAHDRLCLADDFLNSMRARLPSPAPSADPAASLVAGTTSRALGLEGPYLAIDSACAASLQAMLAAARALQLGQIEMAIVGGASTCRADTLIEFSKAQACSATGSRPFDADADGVICSEGYVAIVIKTLTRAVADGDRIHGVVRGLGVSSDGSGAGPWAPQSEGQTLAIRRAYAHGLDMSRVQYIEAHATSTQRGDATELRSLTQAFGAQLPSGRNIPVTSLKANIGHTLEAAGLAGLIKTVLCLQHRIIPPAINVKTPNPKVPWESIPFYTPCRAECWPLPEDGRPRRAGVNAFGLGGLNMHVVVDEFDASRATSVAASRPQTIRCADDDAIAVIGRGCLLPGGDRFEYDWRRHKIPPKQIAQANPLDFMMLEAVDQAMFEAGCAPKTFDGARTGVVVGMEFGGDFNAELQMAWRVALHEQALFDALTQRGLDPQQVTATVKSFSTSFLKRWPALFDATGSFQNSAPASRIARTWDLMGGAASVDSGVRSATAALAICCDLLRSGDCEIMVCATGGLRKSGTDFSQTTEDNLLVPDANVRTRALLLTRYDTALRHGNEVFALIRGSRMEATGVDYLDSLLGMSSVR